uniref:uncharacterized protein LOC120331387 n=1 Tax=Styela clava TaxID=7725 RepID=UPI00193981A7|nr:uncharacterized protein LOC120331387 [Styela clava]
MSTTILIPVIAFALLSLPQTYSDSHDILDNCDQRGDDRVRCFAGGQPSKCEKQGCFMCGANRLSNETKCIRGKACKRTDLTGADNCWGGKEGEENAHDCFVKYKCAWCPDNDKYKCVRDFPKPQPFVDNCDQLKPERRLCRGKANKNSTKCAELGCYYCKNGKPKCIEGIACRYEPSDEDLCWQGEGKENQQDCLRLYKCSWCARNPEGRQCVKDTVIPKDIPTLPPPTAMPAPHVDDCFAGDIKRRQCFSKGKRGLCRKNGCSYCPERKPKCIEGLACSYVPSQAHNCWKGEPGKENAEECKKIYGCSWCKKNPRFKCVSDSVILDPPTISPITCAAKEAVNCFPFVDRSISLAQCENRDPECIFCPEREEGAKCLRYRCPNGYQKRYKSDGCCKSVGSSVSSTSAQRIVNGDEAAEGRWPWMVTVIGNYGGSKTFCGGTLVSKKHVISAAHCLLARDPLRFQGVSYYVEMNSYDRESDDIVKIDVSNIISHEGYVYDGLIQYHSDIMLMELAEEVPDSSNIQPLPLPQGEIVHVGQRCIVTGWGLTSLIDEDVQTKLREIAVDIRSAEDCLGPDPDYDKGPHFCANREDIEVDVCNGDSGGPLACQRCDSCEWYIAGIVSIGHCFDNFGQFPGLFTRVSYYEDWLHANGLEKKNGEYNCDFY